MLIGIPDKTLAPWIGNRKYIMPADEGEGVAIGAGYFYATGKRATVFMSADGFANALNPITNLVIPYGIKMNIVVSYGRKELPHYVMSDLLPKIIDKLPYDSTLLNFEFVKKKS